MALETDLSEILTILGESPPAKPMHNLMPLGAGYGRAPAERKIALDPETKALQDMADSIRGVKQTSMFYGFTNGGLTGKRVLSVSRDAIPKIAEQIASQHDDYLAVVMNVRGKNYIVYANGAVISNPVEVKHKISPNQHKNDWSLIPALTAEIKQIVGQQTRHNIQKPSGIQSFKGFVNVKTGEYIGLPIKTNFNYAISTRPDYFGVKKGLGPLKSRIAAEQRGWVPCGVNGESNEGVTVAISGLTDKHVLAAAKILSRKLNSKHWDVLYLSSNESRKNIKKPDIQNFLFPSKAQAPKEHILDV